MTGQSADSQSIDITHLGTDHTTFAVVHALLPVHAERIISGKRTVFAKFTRHQEINESSSSIQKLMIYRSHECKQIVADAEIVDISLMNPDDVIPTFGDKFFLSRREFEAYTNGRKRPLMVFRLGEIIRYQCPLQLRKPITMGGLCVDRKEYERLLGIAMRKGL